MNGKWALFQLVALAWFFFALVTSLVLSWFALWMRKRIGRFAPASQARLLELWAWGPAWLAGLLTLLCFAPSTFGLFLGLVDHCEGHGDTHAHFCFVHAPLTSGSFLGWILLGGAALLLLLRGSLHLGAVVRAALHVRPLLAWARALPPRQGVEGACEVEAAVPLAVTVGLLRPRPVVSTGLARCVSPDVVEVVLAHERAHAARYDNARKVLFSFGVLLHQRQAAKQLRADFDLACEQACDDAAAAHCGDRLRVAEALLTLARVMKPLPASSVVSSFGEGSVALRVQALLAPPRSPFSVRRVGLGVFLATAIAGSASGALHEGVETLLSWLGP